MIVSIGGVLEDLISSLGSLMLIRAIAMAVYQGYNFYQSYNNFTVLVWHFDPVYSYWTGGYLAC